MISTAAEAGQAAADVRKKNRTYFPESPKKNDRPLVYTLKVCVRLHICVLTAVKDLFLLEKHSFLSWFTTREDLRSDRAITPPPKSTV